jgi:hypothetical protein
MFYQLKYGPSWSTDEGIMLKALYYAFGYAKFKVFFRGLSPDILVMGYQLMI